MAFRVVETPAILSVPTRQDDINPSWLKRFRQSIVQAVRDTRRHVLDPDNQGAGGDVNAIHDNVAAEISAIALKASPAAGDWLIIEDGAAADVKKRVNWSSVGGGGGDSFLEWAGL